MAEDVFAGGAEFFTVGDEGVAVGAEGFEVCGLREVDEKLAEVAEGSDGLENELSNLKYEY